MDFVTPPKLFSDYNLKIFDVESTALKNGQKAFFISNSNSDIVKVSFIFRAGLKHGNPAVIKLLGKVLFDGSKALKGDLLADKIDTFGAYIFNKVGADRFTVSMVCQKKVFKEVWPIFAEAVFNPELDEEKTAIAANREINNLKEAYQYNTVLAEEYFMPAVLGNDNPYNQVLHPGDFEQISSMDLVSFHDKFINIDNGYLLASGHIDENIRDLIIFGDAIVGNGFSANEI
jgi:predicted Zn-dependent peptidase